MIEDLIMKIDMIGISSGVKQNLDNKEIIKVCLEIDEGKVLLNKWANK